MQPLKSRLYKLLRWSERYTRTDMVYLTRGGFWLNCGSLSITFFSLLLYIAFANFLSKEVYGTYQYLLSLGAVVSALTLTGMNAAVTRAVAQGNEGTYLYSLRIQMRWAVLPALGALAGATYYVLQGNYTLAIGLACIAVATPFVSAYSTYSAFLTGKQDFRRVFTYNLAINIPFYSALIAAAYFSASVLILLILNLGTTGLGLWYAHRRVLKTYQPNQSIDKEATTYGKHLSLMGAYSSVALQIDNLLVFHYLGAVELAIYSFATAVPDRLGNFFRFFSISALPKFVSRSDEEIRETLGRKLLGLLGLAAVTFGFYVLFVPFLFAVFFPEYSQSVPYSTLYALTIVSVIGGVSTAALTARKRTRDLYVYNLVSPSLQLALPFIGIIVGGLWGLVIGKTTSIILSTLLATFLVLGGSGRREDS